ncbi:hypothetical protein HMPREF3038_00938 [Akkermansia sp. KLE1797]|nr:hypothetical protein HMPREF3038_00938 [Akkermansia sp. KLE1797]KXU54415.1 hypothetical protein HMPREF3039_01307 [Akkermansia sp. KLE1798]
MQQGYSPGHEWVIIDSTYSNGSLQTTCIITVSAISCPPLRLILEPYQYFHLVNQDTQMFTRTP